MSKAIRKGISHEPNRKSDRKPGRVFVDLGGRKDVASIGGEDYPMIVKDDFTMGTWIISREINQTLAVLPEVFLRVCVLMGSHYWWRLLNLTMEGSFSGGEFASV